MMDYEDLLLKRRSIRNFKDRPIPGDVLHKIIEESTYAPSSSNDQPWQFIIINDRFMMKKISAEAKKNLLQRIAGNANDYAQKYEAMLKNENFNIFYNAPTVVYIFGQKNLKNMKINCALAASYFMLSAAARNLGTCWINFGTVIHSPGLLAELAIPNDCEIVAPIAVGYPAAIPDMPERKAAEILKIIG